MTSIPPQTIKWTRLPNGIHWGVAPIGVAYSLERDHVDGRWIIMIDDLPKQAACEVHTILSTARVWQAPS